MKSVILVVLLFGLAGFCLSAEDTGSQPNNGQETGNEGGDRPEIPNGGNEGGDRPEIPGGGMQSTSCLMRQRALPSIRCDSEGYFEPIQCVNATYCYCVDRQYGQRRSGPHTREEAQGLCQAGSDCTIRAGGETRTIRDGTQVRKTDCEFCRCSNGTITCRNITDCDRIVTPTDKPDDDTYCQTENGRIRVGERTTDGCSPCTCRRNVDGAPELKCAKRSCVDEGEECKCDDEDTEPVCYKGTTYRSRCLLRCRKLDESAGMPGKCRDMDSCQGNTCGAGEVCNRREISCLLPSCTFYNCSSACDDGAAASMRVCGSNGMTYRSRCHLERDRTQTRSGLFVRYEGPCDTTRCPMRPVCGVDGVTYNSSCDARFRITRMDHEGACQKDADSSRRQCPSLARCDSTFTVKTFRSICPICGGICNVALDQRALAQAAAFDENANRNLDSLAGLVQFANISDPLLHRLSLITGCRAEYDIAVDQLEVIYRAVNQSLGRRCADAATIMCRVINDGTLPSPSELNSGNEILSQIPSGDLAQNSASGVFVSAAPSFSQQQIQQGSGSLSFTSATMATVLLSAVVGLFARI